MINSLTPGIKFGFHLSFGPNNAFPGYLALKSVQMKPENITIQIKAITEQTFLVILFIKLQRDPSEVQS